MNTRVLALFIGGVLSLGCISGAFAQANIAVNSLVDAPDFNLLDGVCDCDSIAPGPQCSLRAAVQNANQIGGWVIISLAAQTYNLTFGGTDDLSVAGDLDIFSGTLTRLEINGAPGTIISGAGLITAGTPDRLLHVTGSVANACEIIVRDVTIQKGSGVSFGAGLNQQGGRVTLNNVWFDDCSANDSGGGVHTSSTQRFHHVGGGYRDCDAAFNGGGIFIANPAAASVQLTSLSIFNCDVSSLGGGVRVSANAIVGMSNCTVGSQNTADSGAGISNRGTLTINDSTIASNFASGTGGGIANNIGATLNLNRCTINQNQAGIGGGINNSSTANITDCTIRLNNADTGGGISNTAAAGTPLKLNSSNISSNFATGAVGGAGYRGSGAMEMVNCTMSFNGAQAGAGGAIYFDGGVATAHINASTFAANFALIGGAALFNSNALGATPIIFRNTIVSANTIGGGVSNNFAGAFPPASNGFNIDSDGSCGFVTATDLSSVNPMLGRLQNNGGPTQTRELLAGSPAINTGTCTTIAGNTLTTDQRGFLRSTQCDRGAYEANALPPQICPADISNDNLVNVTDLLAVIGTWGVCASCPPPGGCPADIAPVGPPQGDCLINVSDLLLVISTWGACP